MAKYIISGREPDTERRREDIRLRGSFRLLPCSFHLLYYPISPRSTAKMPSAPQQQGYAVFSKDPKQDPYTCKLVAVALCPSSRVNRPGWLRQQLPKRSYPRRMSVQLGYSSFAHLAWQTLPLGQNSPQKGKLLAYGFSHGFSSCVGSQVWTLCWSVALATSVACS